jgi:hypothetical protein
MDNRDEVRDFLTSRRDRLNPRPGGDPRFTTAANPREPERIEETR